MKPSDVVEGRAECSSSHSAVGMAGLCLLAATLAGVGAVVFVVFEVVHHARSVLPVDVLIAVAFAWVPAVFGLCAFVLFLRIVFALVFGDAPNGRVWVAALLSVLMISLAAAVVLIGTKSHRDWVGLCFLLATIPVSGLTAFTVLRCSSLDRLGYAISLSLTTLLITLVVVLGATTFRAHGRSAAWNLITTGIAVAIAVTAFPRASRSPGRIGLILALCLVLTCGVFSAAGNPDHFVPSAPVEGQAAQRPNVVLIVLDTTRRDRIGCYGHPGGLTPELDRVAGEGVVYEQVISPSSWTIPSHASMFSGLYPSTHGCWNGHRTYLDDGHVTLAELLRDSGYDTAAFVSNFTLLSCNVLQGFETIESLVGANEDLAVHDLARLSGVPERWVDKGADEGYAAIRRWLSHSDRNKAPFFMFLNLFEAHAPYEPPWQERLAGFPAGAEYLRASRRAMKTSTDIFKLQLRASTDPQDKALLGALYDSEMRYQDRKLGEILRLIDGRSPMEHTLLIITADHGENLGEAGRWDHTYELNDVLIHVPFVIRYPELFPAGERVDGLCQLNDLYETVLDVLDVPSPEHVPPRHCLVPARFEPRTAAFAELHPEYSDFFSIRAQLGWTASLKRFDVKRRAIRTRDFKFIWRSDGSHRLYAIAGDPHETLDLLKHRPDLATTLHEGLDAWHALLPKYAPAEEDAEPEPIDEKTLERLRAIGYIQ